MEVETERKSMNGISTHAPILIIDDVEQIRRLLAEVLSQHDCVLAASAEEALDLLKTNTFDVVLSDIVMPELNGYELSDLLAQRFSTLKVVLMTGYSDFVTRKGEVVRPRS